MDACQLSTLGQGGLLTEKSTLEKPQHAFSYHWFCEALGRPGQTQTLGVFYPFYRPNANQLALELAMA